LNYAVYKSEYFWLSEERLANMSMRERNEHYFDVDEEFTIAIEGVLSLTLDAEALQDGDLDDEDLKAMIITASSEIEINDMKVASEETEY